jgi:hypothetical protein
MLLKGRAKPQPEKKLEPVSGQTGLYEQQHISKQKSNLSRGELPSTGQQHSREGTAELSPGRSPGSRWQNGAVPKGWLIPARDQVLRPATLTAS